MTRPIDPALVESLRAMARTGRPPSEMFDETKRSLGKCCHIISHFRHAFSLSLSEAKPLAGFSRSGSEYEREVLDEAGLDALLLPDILKHRDEWDN